MLAVAGWLACWGAGDLAPRRTALGKRTRHTSDVSREGCCAAHSHKLGAPICICWDSKVRDHASANAGTRLALGGVGSSRLTGRRRRAAFRTDAAAALASATTPQNSMYIKATLFLVNCGLCICMYDMRLRTDRLSLSPSRDLRRMLSHFRCCSANFDDDRQVLVDRVVYNDREGCCARFIYTWSLE